MKRFVLLAVSIVLVSILFCPVVIAAPAIPDDIQIVQPDPSLPKGLSAFLGKWEGTDRYNIDYMIIFVSINEEKATLYTWWSCCPPAPDAWQKYEYSVIKEGPDKYTLVLHSAPTPKLDPCGNKIRIYLQGRQLIQICQIPITFHRATSW